MKKLFLLAALMAGTAHAQFFSGNEILQRMEAQDSVVGRSLALGYVAGVLDAAIDVDICPPEQVQIGQARDMVLQWLRANPDKRHLPAAVIVHVVLRNAWPCKQNLKPGGKL